MIDLELVDRPTNWRPNRVWLCSCGEWNSLGESPTECDVCGYKRKPVDSPFFIQAPGMDRIEP